VLDVCGTNKVARKVAEGRQLNDAWLAVLVGA
jgi:hypothetical protein